MISRPRSTTSLRLNQSKVCNRSFNTSQVRLTNLGARAYYLRNIIHDWADEQAIAILKNQISAMSDDSVILIDDMVLPEKGSPWRATQLDMTMLAALAAMERSENQWYELLEKAGLDVIKIWKYTEECDDCIIVAKPKKG
jgi:hypothetical protein